MQGAKGDRDGSAASMAATYSAKHLSQRSPSRKDTAAKAYNRDLDPGGPALEDGIEERTVYFAAQIRLFTDGRAL